MTFTLGRGGLPGEYPENSPAAFSAALKAGMDGFHLGVQPTRDAVCVVMHDFSATSDYNLRKLKYSELPRLENGEAIPRLSDILDFQAKLINIELVGEPGWKNALAAVEASEALGRVFFSSLEHSEILQLWGACPHARCSFIWEEDEAGTLTDEEISNLPEALLLCIPIDSVSMRVDFWEKHAHRLVIWNAVNYGNIMSIGFKPQGCIVSQMNN